jgi:probable 2-oxoglutarate dehydrogenase E1 component DHKTD1
MHRNFRKPLVIAAPKIGLKHPKAYSSISEFEIGSKFQPTLST